MEDVFRKYSSCRLSLSLKFLYCLAFHLNGNLLFIVFVLVSFPFHLICDCCVTNDAFSERRRCIIKIASRMFITVGCLVCFSGHDPRHRQLDLLLSVRPSAVVIIHLLCNVLCVACSLRKRSSTSCPYSVHVPKSRGDRSDRWSRDCGTNFSRGHCTKGLLVQYRVASSDSSGKFRLIYCKFCSRQTQIERPLEW